jgi:cytochrome c-type biogenesis protein CcsB
MTFKHDMQHMKKMVDFLFSSRLMAIVLALFALSIAAATFIENDFGADSARAMIYNARWFECLIFIGIINLLGTIIRKRMFYMSRLTIFVFHLSFALILIGAAITHFTGFEGTMSIQEGETSDKVLTEKTYIEVNSESGYIILPVYFSALGKNNFRNHFRYHDQNYKLICKSFIANAIPDIMPDPDGKPLADIVFTDSTGRKSLILAEGDKKIVGSVAFSFNAAEPDPRVVKVYALGDSLIFEAPFEVTCTNMADQSRTILHKQKPCRLFPMKLYTFQNTMVVMSQFLTRAKKTARPVSKGEGQTFDALIMELSSAGNSKEFTLWGKSGYSGVPETVALEKNIFSISYGSVFKQLPFELKLNDFIVDRYPGSNSPSWFESRVVLTDKSRHVSESRRIFMNNILKYRGYRFYQSSYNPDEKGTILSVNRDWTGTGVTYAGYLLMGLGMILSLLNRNSRFRSLSIANVQLKAAKKGLAVLILIFFLRTISMAQETLPGTLSHNNVDLAHANLFGKLLVQDNGGRIEPINTLGSDVLKKLYRKNEYKGLTADQVIIGMLVDPASWQHEPVIRATHPQIQEIMGSKEKYFSFASFFHGNTYILHDYVENAFRKKPADRSKFDNEIIRLDERINICYLVFTGDLLRILPAPNDSTHTWYSFSGIRGHVSSKDSAFFNNILPLYIQDVQESMQTGDWKGPNDIVRAVSNFQTTFSGAFVPSSRKIAMEVFLNRSEIFSRIANLYGMVGFVLLMLQFISLFFTRIKIKVPVIISMILIIIAFIFHTAGLGMRWYVSGHAPWSNGYEALTYIAWATVLAGLIFSSRSSITLSSTSILAFLILYTAHLSWMDPQITNLVPVLKSYWLVIHVATITASYGFLALGALLAAINLILMILLTRKSFGFIDLTIKELTNIIEMTLIVGLYLLTIGTFLGGVWANESWGRYWGWDPKETWALVTVIIYAFITHMRLVPGLRGVFGFNLASLIGFSSVIMTYFGVNYYLSGLHSYAKGDPLPVPPFVYYSLVVVFALAMAAFLNYRKHNGEAKKNRRDFPAP